MIWQCRRHRFDLSSRCLLMGVLNVTPDSFSEQGENYLPEPAIAAGLAMAAAGADLIDVGGESTRPGSQPVSAAEECRRVLPVLRGLRARLDLALSIDTCKAEVAAAALEAGADIVNDISGGHLNPALPGIAASYRAGVVAMHMRGTPLTMQEFCQYHDLIGELNQYFADTLATFVAAGVPREAVALDPGLGFSKTPAQNLELIARLGEFAGHGRPLLLGPSRKSFIGKTLNIVEPRERLWGTAAAVAVGIVRGARIVRVHDVAEMRQVRDLTLAILQAPVR